MALSAKAKRARLCFRLMMGYSLFGAALSLGSLLYHGLVEQTPFLIDGVPYMAPLSTEWCLTAAYCFMHALCAYLLSSGRSIARRWDAQDQASRRATPNASATAAAAPVAGATGAAGTSKGKATVSPDEVLDGSTYAMPTRVAVGCAVLFSVALMYLLFVGTVSLSAQIERTISAAPPNLEERADPSWKLPTSVPVSNANAAGEAAQEASSTAAPSVAADGGETTEAAASESVSAGASAPATQAASEGQCGALGKPGSGPNGELTMTEMFWVTLETVVDVFASLIDTDNGDDDAQGYDGFATGMGSRYKGVSAKRASSTAAPSSPYPIHYLRRLDLVVLNLCGAALSLWGIVCFDLTIEESKRRRNRPDGRPSRAYLAAQRADAARRKAGGGAQGAKPATDPRGFAEGEEPESAPEKHENPGLTLAALGALSVTQGDSKEGTTGDLSKRRKAKAAAHVAQEAAAASADAVAEPVEAGSQDKDEHAVASPEDPVLKKNQ